MLLLSLIIAFSRRHAAIFAISYVLLRQRYYAMLIASPCRRFADDYLIRMPPFR